MALFWERPPVRGMTRSG